MRKYKVFNITLTVLISILCHEQKNLRKTILYGLF